MTSASKGTAVVTGASTGIGAIYADRLARRGYDLILVARNRARLDEIAGLISDRSQRAVEVVAADLTNRRDLARVEEALKRDASITMLVNNAGIGAPAPTWKADVDLMERLIAINVTALTRLTYAIAPGFVARGGGTIINIASVVAVAPELPFNSVYNASKAFVLSLSQSLHYELADLGVTVQAVLPGATATDFWDGTDVPRASVPAHIMMAADQMVDAALAGLDLGERVTIPSLPDSDDWAAFEGARAMLLPNLSRVSPAERYTSVPVGSRG
jgi:short-subunit dehydrogenase